MTKLEYIYLMNVALHLESIEDVMNFESINKKSQDVLLSLKVNPWLKSKFEKSTKNNENRKEEDSIEKFQRIFKKTTCNCFKQFVSSKILDECEKIRNLKIIVDSSYLHSDENCHLFLSNNKSEILDEKILNYIEKADSIHFEIRIDRYSSCEKEEIIVKIIEKLKRNVKLIFSSLEGFKLFDEIIEKKKLLFYPKECIIYLNDEEIRQNIIPFGFGGLNRIN